MSSYTIAVLSSKGGVGKSSIVCAVCAVLSMFAPRHRTLAVDAGGQANTMLYLTACGDLLPNVDVDAVSDSETIAAVPLLKTEHTFKILDLPGYSEATELKAVLKKQDSQAPGIDLAIIPMQASEFDLESVVPFVVETVVPTGVPYGIVLSRVSPRALSEAMDLQRQLHADGLDTFSTIIREYRGVRDAQRDHKPITMFGGRHDTARAAEDDYRALTREALKRLGSRIHIPTRADQAEEARRHG